MMLNKKFLTLVPFVAALLLIAAFLILPHSFFERADDSDPYAESRVINAGSGAGQHRFVNDDEPVSYESIVKQKVALQEGEIAVVLITEDLDGSPDEEQIIAYKNMNVENNPVYLTFIDFDTEKKIYKRLWSTPTAITQISTVSMYTEDLIGDRSRCVIITGMNKQGERIMNVFLNQNKTSTDILPSAKEIADIKIDGIISVIEAPRTQAYHLGMTNGETYKISAHGRDTSSSNPMDQIEVTYQYNQTAGRYVQESVKHIPGAQIEAQQLRNLLNGNAKEFEQFIDGLWYHINSDGTVDSTRYVFFDTKEREILFYDEDTQQVYSWKNSTSTRYGLYISTQNISVATLRRIMDIELGSLDSIRIKVFEDVHMRIAINAPWDGIYRKVSAKKLASKKPNISVQPFINAHYLSTIGNVQFFDTGDYEIEMNGTIKKGRYVFFGLEENELLEFLPVDKTNRETYRVIRNEKKDDTFSLERIVLTVRGLQEFHDAPLIFTKHE
ncbi:MAG: pallilysin-related adhesin [Spirochaetaceae bacterium]|jgi:hypothetical protein|nr:pallilysin-related adhesin [Spirochaetaceae bacterium]